MADIINFNKARKEKAKADARAKAAENRAARGQSKIFKTALQIQLEKAKKDLDAHQRDKPKK